MLTIHGKGVSAGVAIGRARLFRRQSIGVSRMQVENADREWQRYETARMRAVRELEALSARRGEQLGQSDAHIFSIHAMIAYDEDFNETVREHILKRHDNAEYAVSEAAKRHATVFAQMDDDYMRERADDVKDVAARIVRHLAGMGGDVEQAAPTDGAAGDIVCAEDLTPSETVQLDRRAVGAFVTARGSSNSHTAILARTMGLPAVVSVGEAFGQIRDGALLALDADEGAVYVEPDEATLQRLRCRMEQSDRMRERLGAYRGRKSQTPDGRRVEICANAGSLEDVQAAVDNDADGIGLFRSEFLYIGRGTLPSEVEQLAAYRRVLQAMPDKRVIVRTLDVGADKQADCLKLAREENPALGLRAVRISLTRPALFLTQARALLRASMHGRLAVMFPFITSVDEVRRLFALWAQAKDELRAQGVPFSEDVEIGIMIETPAAAIISDRLAPLVDFFSIGSNDLTQYTLALDRQNAALDEFCDTHHEAVLRLIRTTVENARRAGIWVGICGELGADLSLSEEFVRMGVDEISVTPPSVLPLRERVCTMQIGDGAAVKKQEREMGGPS